ncbi:MAG: hypothetical protein AAFV69_06730 [Pseudomonadota bacterium]
MRRYSTASVVGLFAAFVAMKPIDVHADMKGCSAWDLSVQQQEEGREWTASVCASKQDTNTILEVRCFGSDVGVRYMPAVDFPFPDKGRDIEYVVDGRVRPVFVQYEGMDGALSAYIPFDHTVVQMLKSGANVEIRDPESVAPTRTFILTGARKAIDGLVSRCRN